MTRALAWLSLAAACAVVLLGCSTRDEVPGPCREDYATCTESAQCGGGATCKPLVWSFGHASACARSCNDERDCPRSGARGGRCIDVNRSGEFQCYADCELESECPVDWVCQPISSGGVPSGICLP